MVSQCRTAATQDRRYRCSFPDFATSYALGPTDPEAIPAAALCFVGSARIWHHRDDELVLQHFGLGFEFSSKGLGANLGIAEQCFCKPASPSSRFPLTLYMSVNVHCSALRYSNVPRA